jgi:hypothetical protein
MGTSSQNTLLNNFSPVQPILASNILIDSALQAEAHEYINNLAIFILFIKKFIKRLFIFAAKWLD